MFIRIDLIQCGVIPVSSIRTNSIALGKNLLVTRVSNKGGTSLHMALNTSVLSPDAPIETAVFRGLPPRGGPERRVQAGPS